MAALRTALKRLLYANHMTVSSSRCDGGGAAAALGRGALLPSMCAALAEHGFSSLVRWGDALFSNRDSDRDADAPNFFA